MDWLHQNGQVNILFFMKFQSKLTVLMLSMYFWEARAWSLERAKIKNQLQDIQISNTGSVLKKNAPCFFWGLIMELVAKSMEFL